jgi:hypothetical protein
VLKREILDKYRDCVCPRTHIQIHNKVQVHTNASHEYTVSTTGKIFFSGKRSVPCVDGCHDSNYHYILQGAQIHTKDSGFVCQPVMVSTEISVAAKVELFCEIHKKI